MSNQAPTYDKAQHDRLYEEAADLMDGLIVYHDQNDFELDAHGRKKLERAMRLFEHVVQMNPRNWPAFWLMGKIYQRFKDNESALDCFSKSHQNNPTHRDVAREAAIAAMESRKPELAVGFCERAIQAQPSNAGLRANLALALLFSDRPHEAREVVSYSLKLDPNDTITANIRQVIDEVINGSRPCPHHTDDLN
jgi:tetratricopeptide (TPR) repeat protein